MVAMGMHISRRTLRGVLALVGVAAITFFGVTRTQFGRDSVADRLEAQFAKSTEGTLRIGRLTGNLVQSFTATGVQIEDRRGNTILSVDTVFVRPSWEDLLRRRFDAPEIHLKGARVNAIVDPTGRMLWEDLLPINKADSLSENPWSFRSAHILVDGGIWTSRGQGSDAPPDTVADGIQLDFRVEQRDRGHLIDLLAASGHGRTRDIEIRTATGQALVDSNEVRIVQAHLVTKQSELNLSGFLTRTERPELSIRLSRSPVSFDEVAELIPDFPLRGRGFAALAGSGGLSDFVITGLNVGAGSSQLSASGTVRGLPDSASVDLLLAVTPLRLGDLRRAVPDLAIPGRLSVDSLVATAYLSGTFHPRGDSLAGRGLLKVDASGAAGTAGFVGTVTLLEGKRVQLAGDLTTTQLDIGQIYLTSLGSTALNSIASLDLSAGLDDWSIGGLQGTVSAVFRQSSLGPAFVDVLRVNASQRLGDRRQGMQAEGTATARLVQPGGTSVASIGWSGGPAPELNGVLETKGLDLGPLLGRDDVDTELAARVEAHLTRTTNWFGTVTVATDSSSIRRAGLETRTGQQRLTMELLPRGPTPRGSLDRPRLPGVPDSSITLNLSGSVAKGTIAFNQHPRQDARMAQFWAGALADAARREWRKPYSSGGVTLEPLDDVRATVLRNSALGEAGRSTLLAEGRIDWPDLSRLSVWRPGARALTGTARSSFSVAAGVDTFQVAGAVTTDSLVLGGVAVYGGNLSLRASASFAGPVEEDLAVSIRTRIDSVRTLVSDLPSVAIDVDFMDREGRVRVAGDRGDRLGPYSISGTTDLLDDRVRFRIDTMSVDARQYAWRLDSPAILDLFNDAVTVGDLSLIEGSGAQHFRASGTLSDDPADTLRVQAAGIRLEGVTEFGTLRRDLGGALNADLLLTGGLSEPRAAGVVDVPAFVLDDWLLGAVQLETTLTPGTRDIAVSLAISPSGPSSQTRPVGEVLENRLSLSGSVRPPTQDDAGAWDLKADVERADLFFLKYAFNESVDRVAGFAAGTGTISGPFGKPVVDAELEVREGAFGIPRIGARYTYSASVHIDQDAVHIDEARLVDQDGGFADISGPLLFNDYRFFSFDLVGTLNDLLVMNRSETIDLPFYGFIRGTGSATLTGPLANATLRIPNGVTRSDSELYIPLVDAVEEGDASFIIFADSTGRLPDLQRLIRRPFFLARRASAERKFLDGLDMDLNIEVPRGSLIHLVIDPLLGDVINAESTGRVQLRRSQGEFEAFGQMEVLGGDYLFTAGEVFVRRFVVQPGGTISWVGDPVNARLDIPAAYRTRASTAGLNDVSVGGALIPLVVELRIQGQVLSPTVGLGLSIDRSSQNLLGDYQALEAKLNQPDRAPEYATSVLLTNSFQLTTDNLTAHAGEQLAFNSVSQLVSSQLSRFLDAALPNVDLIFGLQGERAEDLDVTYGVALRLLDERLVIRGEGVYQGSNTDNARANTQGLQGEFVVEVRLSPSVSAQVFFRREGDILQNADLTNTAGAGLTYQTDFPSWRRVWQRLFRGGLVDKAPTPSGSDDDGGP
jgi:translocation and assembly module TamB